MKNFKQLLFEQMSVVLFVLALTVMIFSQGCALMGNNMDQPGNASLEITQKMAVNKSGDVSVLVECEVIYKTGTEKTKAGFELKKGPDCDVTITANVDQALAIGSHKVVAGALDKQAEEATDVVGKVAEGLGKAISP